MRGGISVMTLETGSRTSRIRGTQPASRPRTVPNTAAARKPQKSSRREPQTSARISFGFSTYTWNRPSGDGISRSLWTSPSLKDSSHRRKKPKRRTAISDVIFFFAARRYRV